MSHASVWAPKVLALLRGGNTTAALAQIKVAPSVRDLEQLRAAFAAANHTSRLPHVDEAIADQIDAMSAPRLHRSP
jgi:hypothetical protein